MRFVCVLFFGACFLVPTMVTARDARWVTTRQWSGVDRVTTEVFRVTGSKWRIGYDPRGDGRFEIIVRSADGEPVARAAGRREVLRGRKTFDGRGEFYLEILGKDVSWDIKILQHVSLIEEWRLHRWRENRRPVLEKIAVWTGTDAAEYSIDISGPRWKAVATNSGDGVLNVTILNGEDRPILNSESRGPGRIEGWGHYDDELRVRANSDGSEWKLELYEVPSLPDTQSSTEGAAASDSGVTPLRPVPEPARIPPR